MTGTDLCMNVLEEFGESEAQSVLVIWTNDAGEVAYTSNCSSIEEVGLVEFVKSRALRRLNGEGGKIQDGD